MFIDEYKCEPFILENIIDISLDRTCASAQTHHRISREVNTWPEIECISNWWKWHLTSSPL